MVIKMQQVATTCVVTLDFRSVRVVVDFQPVLYSVVQFQQSDCQIIRCLSILRTKCN